MAMRRPLCVSTLFYNLPSLSDFRAEMLLFILKL